MSTEIDYGNLMHDAMRGLIKTVLRDIAKNGLPGSHHFFITFDTTHPDAELADWLSDRYPDEMTVVIQHWFSNLIVSDDNFAITLNFGDSPEPLIIPYDAIKTFVDPSVEFGLRFEAAEGDGNDLVEVMPTSIETAKVSGPEAVKTEAVKTETVKFEANRTDTGKTDTGKTDTGKPKADKPNAEVVSLDSFRK